MAIFKISRTPIIILLFSFLVISCSERRSSNYSLFEKRYALVGEIILEDEVDATGLYMLDSFLLVKTRGNQGVHFNVYHSKKLEKFGSFGYVGEGVNEFMSARLSGDFIEINNEKYLIISDLNFGKVTYFNFSHFIKTGKETYVNEFNPSFEHGLTQSVFQINDSIMVSTPGMDAKERGRLLYYNLSSDSSFVTDLFPSVKDNNLNAYDLYALYFSQITINKDKRLIASAMDGFNRIDMFDFEGKLIKSMVTGDSDHITKRDRLTVDGALLPYMSHYMYVTSTEKYIFSLYYGQNFMEIGTVKIDPVINVFTWDGEFYCQLMLNDYLSQFAVDTENFLIYAIDRYPDRILRYDIRDIFSSL
ncbi:hypothetical protein ADIS_1587 [Lunatimonas lonarensis]|uniref:Lipoprotein n=1 Tax=Lunatimonas lonarensis TaxID=1232681 RepID=R7ZV70_9BACT|nr:hypothetical protein ADIS_1587 [Lunatimonas lonarensis]